MKVRFLLQYRNENGEIDISCPSTELHLRGYADRDAAHSAIKLELANYLRSLSAPYVKTRSETDGMVNCPESFVKLPIDLWCCKLNGEKCPIQAQVFVADGDRFISGCTAPDKRKQDIYKTVEARRYKGFHHVPGRYLCPACNTKTNFDYHYKFELTFVNDIIGPLSDAERDEYRVQLIRKNMPIYINSNALCPKCIVNALGKTHPYMLMDLEVLEVDFFPR